MGNPSLRQASEAVNNIGIRCFAMASTTESWMRFCNELAEALETLRAALSAPDETQARVERYRIALDEISRMSPASYAALAVERAQEAISVEEVRP